MVSKVTVLNPSTLNHTVLIGAGNLAYHLARWSYLSKYSIDEIYSRSYRRAAQIGDEFAIASVRHLSDLSGDPCIFLLAVNDDQIARVAIQLKRQCHPDSIFVHCSGATSLQSLLDVHERVGVFYPLSTFTEKVPMDYDDIPIFIEGSTKTVKSNLAVLARKLGQECISIDSEQRLHLHLAAVWVNNFVNLLFSIGGDLVRAQGLDFKHLAPLIRHTIEKLEHSDPAETQTGPAKRGDLDTIKKHLDILDNNANRKELYKLLSTMINPNLTDLR